ncbi:MAG TPA: hypothetical protein VGV09_00910 [Steroidobacteraceae bacterium]|nr:hypothetical protein [Steroidobacteraceae bacterium]
MKGASAIRQAARLASLGLLLAALLLAGVAGRAVAGPPFQTDDPEPVDLGHYEFYVFSGTDNSTQESDPIGPAFEFNWGALPNTQLHAVMSFGGVVPAGEGAKVYGLLDTELGVKYRFISQTDDRPEVGIFPMVELPTGRYSRGLGVGKTWYKLPLWIQKDWGPWTTYGGAGYEVVPQTGFNNFPYAGWLVQRDAGDKWTLGGEVWYHGPEGPATPLSHATTMFDFGGSYYFRKPAFQLLFALGHSVAGQTETYAYLGLYWTWGEGAEKATPTALAGWSMNGRSFSASDRYANSAVPQL